MASIFKRKPNTALLKAVPSFLLLPASVDREGVVKIRIYGAAITKATLKALQSGSYQNARIVHVLSAEKVDHKNHDDLLPKIGKLPLLEEIYLDGVYAHVNTLRETLQQCGDKLKRLYIRNCTFIVAHPTSTQHLIINFPETRVLFAVIREQLKVLELFEMITCFELTESDRPFNGHRRIFPHKGLIRSLACVPSLQVLSLKSYWLSEFGPLHLKPLFRSCFQLREVSLQGFVIEKDAWQYIVPAILGHGCLEKLHLGRVKLNEEVVEHLERLLTSRHADFPNHNNHKESPLVDFQIAPAQGYSNEHFQSTSNCLGRLAAMLPRALGSHCSRLCRCIIGGHLSCGAFVNHATQVALLDLLQRTNTTLEDLSLGGCACFVPYPSKAYELNGQVFETMDGSNPILAGVDHFLKLNQYGARCLLETPEEVLHVLCKASDDVPCLFDILHKHHSLFQLRTI